MLIWLASYPRSGNHWLRILLHQLYNVPTDAIYPEDSSGHAARLMGYAGGVADVRKAKRSARWHFVKTHENPADDNPAIYIVRDGRDTLVSHAHYAIAHNAGYDIDGNKSSDHSAVLERMIIHGAWGDHVRAWTARANTVTVRFEDLVRTPVHTTMWAMQEIGYDGKRHNGRLPTFEELQANEGVLFRRGKIGAYKDEMPPRLQALFMERYGDLEQWLNL